MHEESKEEVKTAMFTANPFSKTDLFQANPFLKQQLDTEAKSDPRPETTTKIDKTEMAAAHTPEPLHVLSLLESSFTHMPSPQDQEVIDPKHPSAVSEVHNYPTVPLFNRKEHFARLNLETLFFAFYH